jgi:hypothetical protein
MYIIEITKKERVTVAEAKFESKIVENVSKLVIVIKLNLHKKL